MKKLIKIMEWSNICKMMRNAPRQSEIAYQTYIKDVIFDIALGWNANQINEQFSLQLGSTERLVPDLLISKDNKNRFVVEVKKPGRKKSKGDIEQLISYMKQLETPVGIYWGDELEVYWKTIGDGSSQVLLLSLNFNVLNEKGDVFVSLFSVENFSIDKVLKFKNELAAQVVFDLMVKDTLEKIESSIFKEKVKELIKDHLLDQGIEKKVVETAMEKVSISIFSEQPKKVIEEKTESSYVSVSSTRIRANRGTAQRYAYNLICQIIEKNNNLNFDQLFAIFGRKNRIEKVSEIKDDSRWCLREEDIITLPDGTKVAVSNQWGFNGASKPKMDELREIAKRFGIDVNLPQ